ncbi:glycosyltransferase [Clostridium sp. SM-530-WT-3G]|uniref:MGDG synthase family glycosyltransferase n=1 Tax=Clostridium sp. SM-530-WT-3G TaxID=2725303 RepID=UPI00145E6094|nr:glycosyltransferase [Clostridium sp. SM-530-WT-3G]NME82635.1 glycosyltransferase [Clostridium sp. SM-530-WT-3G]
MKKVLILTISTGQGHNQAATSIGESFKESGYELITHDFLARNSKFLNDVVVIGYKIMASKFPKIYGWFYNLTNTPMVNSLLNIPFIFPKKKVSKLIHEVNPDVIIGTHALSTRIVSNLKKEGLKTPYILTVTDFKAHYTYISSYVDAYITGSNYTKKSLIEKNIDANKIYPIGIPIDKKFYINVTNADDLKDNQYFNLLLMGGSFGLDIIFIVMKELLKNRHKLRITVVCGKNEQLKKLLTDYCNNNTFTSKKVHILGFTNDIPYLMDYCDVIVSKPGGLTVTESIVKNIPLIIPFSIPGQENENIDFLTSEGYSVKVDSIQNLNSEIDNLIENPEKLKLIKNRIKTLADTYSLDKIVDIAENLIKN